MWKFPSCHWEEHRMSQNMTAVPGFKESEKTSFLYPLQNMLLPVDLLCT